MESADPQAAFLRLAAGMVPAYGTILAIGPDDAAIAAYLPAGCALLHEDSTPERTEADVILHLAPDGDASSLAAAAVRLGKPFLCRWPLEGPNDPRFLALREAMRVVGFRLQCGEQVMPALALLKWVPGEAHSPARPKRVLVLSHYHIPNFGDRLGYHLLNRVLPADAEVTYGALRPWDVPDDDYDLLVLGIGNSLLPKDAANPDLLTLVDRIPSAIGIFGTQYREQFLHHAVARSALDRILAKVTTWWARYEEDLLAFGRGRGNVRHLGDWLIAAAPLARPRLDKALTIPAEIYSQEVALDRMIQRIQSYRRVSSGRLHTLLAALPSAEQVAYQEQRLDARFRVPGAISKGAPESGKFRSLLYDVFGRTFDEDRPFAVDREAVLAYKRKVQTNIEALRAQLFALLGSELPAPPPPTALTA